MSTIPLKEQRTKCWAAKDSYWECLDSNQQASEKCAELKEAFNASCSKTWVSVICFVPHLNITCPFAQPAAPHPLGLYSFVLPVTCQHSKNKNPDTKMYPFYNTMYQYI